MKNYTRVIENSYNRRKQQEEFIVNYQNDNNKEIIINYADGTKEHILYSKEKELEILKKMEEQVNKYSFLMGEFSFDNKYKLSKMNLENRIAIFFVSVIAAGGMISSVGIVPAVLFPCVLFACLFHDIPGIIKDKRMITDFEKNLMFIRNKEKINKIILDVDNTIIQDISKILTDVIVNMPDGKKGITINVLEKISLSKLEKILKHVNLVETFRIMEEAYNKKKAIILEKGKEIERQVLEEKRRPFVNLLTIEDVARMRYVDEVRRQYNNDLPFVNMQDRNLGYTNNNVKKRMRKK